MWLLAGLGVYPETFLDVEKGFQKGFWMWLLAGLGVYEVGLFSEIFAVYVGLYPGFSVCTRGDSFQVSVPHERALFRCLCVICRALFRCLCLYT